MSTTQTPTPAKSWFQVNGRQKFPTLAEAQQHANRHLSSIVEIRPCAPPRSNRPLCPREIRGMITIAMCAPQDLCMNGQPLRSVLASLEAAISSGRPDKFLKDCTRETAANWCRR